MLIEKKEHIAITRNIQDDDGCIREPERGEVGPTKVFLTAIKSLGCIGQLESSPKAGGKVSFARPYIESCAFKDLLTVPAKTGAEASVYV